MREIKFRGFTTDCIYMDNEWIYGDLIHYDEDEFYIIPQNNSYHDIADDDNRIDKQSIGQFTGFKDKNGKEIYEGDILKLIDEDGIITYVEWDKEYTGFSLIEPTGHIVSAGMGNWTEEDTEVIGNIFENKELLKTE